MPPAQTPSKLLFIIVAALAAVSIIGVSALCISLFYKNYADPAILTALIAITSGATGNLASMLNNTRQAAQPTNGSTTTTTTTAPAKVTTETSPQPAPQPQPTPPNP
jgi:hypothetical protein